MRPFTCSVTIDTPRERVFEYLEDVANHVEFSDHYLKDFRLERVESRGVGAAARFRIALGKSLWGEIGIAELERPFRIALEGEAGRLGRVKVHATYTLTAYGQDMTRLEYSLSTTPATRTAELRLMLGGRTWIGLQSRKALRRLAQVLEEGQPRAHAAGVAPG
jgi:uncharacterized protein YndB with AHSA1/START domain